MMSFQPTPFVYRDYLVITPLSPQALGTGGTRGVNIGSAASRTWVANLAIFVPFGIYQPFLVQEVFWLNGSAAGNNVDVGVYDTAGNRLFSLGSTAQGLASGVVSSSGMTDFQLAPGDYYMAFACDGTTNDVGGWAHAGNVLAALGVGQAASAFPLPDPATIVPNANALLPFFGLNGYTVAA